MSTTDRESASGVQVIARAAAILREVKVEPAGLSLAQLASRLDLPRSTVQRIVGALQQERLLVATTSGRGIRLGPEVQALARSARSVVAGEVRPFLAEIAERTGETVDLAVLRGDRVVFIDQAQGRHRLRTVSSIGESFDVLTTANGKAAAALRADPDATGLSYDVDEHTPGVSAVGAAVVGIDGEIYAISVPVPSSRFVVQRDEIVAVFTDALERIRGLDVVDAVPALVSGGG